MRERERVIAVSMWWQRMQSISSEKNEWIMNRLKKVNLMAVWPVKNSTFFFFFHFPFALNKMVGMNWIEISRAKEREIERKCGKWRVHLLGGSVSCSAMRWVHWMSGWLNSWLSAYKFLCGNASVCVCVCIQRIMNNFLNRPHAKFITHIFLTLTRSSIFI